MKRLALVVAIVSVGIVACAEREKEPEPAPAAAPSPVATTPSPGLKHLNIPVKRPLMGGNKLAPSAHPSASASPQ